MNDKELKQNADFLSIALEEMEPGTVQYEFVEDTYHNLLDAVDDTE